MLLIERGELYAPDALGRQSVLVAGGRIEAVGMVDLRAGVTALDASDCIVVPAFTLTTVDLSGLTARDLVESGITGFVASGGVDLTTDSPLSLLQRVRSFQAAGLDGAMWSGGHDGRSITGSMRDDIVAILEIAGAGPIALSDLRSREMSAQELARFASDCHLASELAQKRTLVHVQVGSGKRRFARLFETLRSFDVDPSWFHATLLSDDEEVLREAAELTRRGTSIGVAPHLLTRVRDLDADPAMIVLNEAPAAPVRLQAQRGGAPSGSILPVLGDLVRRQTLTIADLIAFASTNPARILGRSDRGHIAAGARADLLLLDRGTLELRAAVVAGHPICVDGGKGEAIHGTRTS